MYDWGKGRDFMTEEEITTEQIIREVSRELKAGYALGIYIKNEKGRRIRTWKYKSEEDGLRRMSITKDGIKEWNKT
jgi:hypothetical protein